MQICPAKPGDANWLQDSFAVGLNWRKPAGYFQGVLDEQAAGALILLLALEAGDYLGHCKLVWSPDYAGFRERGIPEIQDLNVIRSRRRIGVASRLLDEAEARIARRSRLAGIGFGLYADYGAAQRLYILRGYVPDGQGAHYFGEPLPPGATCALDDNLALYLVKQLR
ncbi:MAG: GNAT family N-acetyltransferase [Chloroflexi bacterium]|nr:GNAT family N-acetyltransferase [Chloroflexota bacterium]MCY4247828.1 GNAT family N-acetyltransferase [Chloroflexota bacterium]